MDGLAAPEDRMTHALQTAPRTSAAAAGPSADVPLVTYATDAHREPEVGQTTTDAVPLPLYLSLVEPLGCATCPDAG